MLFSSVLYYPTFMVFKLDSWKYTFINSFCRWQDCLCFHHKINLLIEEYHLRDYYIPVYLVGCPLTMCVVTNLEYIFLNTIVCHTVSSLCSLFKLTKHQIWSIFFAIMLLIHPIIRENKLWVSREPVVRNCCEVRHEVWLPGIEDRRSQRLTNLNIKQWCVSWQTPDCCCSIIWVSTKIMVT